MKYNRTYQDLLAKISELEKHVRVNKYTEDTPASLFQKFSSFYDCLPVAICVENSENGNIEFINKSWLDLFELKDKDVVIGKQFNQIDVNIVNIISLGFHRNKSQINFNTSYGTSKTGVLSSERTTIDNKEFILHTLEEIIENSINNESIRLKTIINTVDDPIFVKDNDHRIILANNAFCKIFNVEEKDLIGKTLAEKVPENERKHFLSVDRRVLDTGIDDVREETLTTDNYTHTIVTKKIRIVEPTGKKFLVGSIHDITEYKKKERELIRAKEKVEESNSFSNSIIQTIPFGMEIVDEKGSIQFISQNLAVNFETNVIGKKCWEVFCDDQKRCKDCPLRSEIEIGKTKIITAENILNGKIFEISHTGMMYKGKKALLEIFYDITDRKNIEKELIKAKLKAEENEERFRNFFEQSLIGFAITSIEKGWIEVNDILCEFLEYTRDELFQKTWSELTHPEDLESDLFQFNRLLKGEINSYKLDKRFISKTGKVIYTELSVRGKRDANGEIKYFLALINNITDRKILELDLIKSKELAEESENQLKKAQKTAKVGNWIWYISENRLWWSDEMYNIFEIDQNNFKGNLEKVIEESIHPDDKYEVEQSNISVLKHNKPIPVEYRIISKDGSVKYVLGIADHIVLDEYGKSKILTGIVKDITEYKIIQNELTIAKEKAEESNKLKTAFLNNISHEVRTPLNAIVGFSNLLTKSNQPPEKLQKFATHITYNSDQLLSIISNVIEISQIQSRISKLQTTQFDLVLLLHNITNNFRKEAHEKHLTFTFSTNIADNEFLVISDKEKISKILIHFINNAIKFTLKGLVSVNCILENEEITFTITDTGIGISKEMQEVIFEPFRQIETGTTRNYGGNGLGLSIAKAYIEILQGSVTMKSELNKGTTFKIMIPLKIPSTNHSEKIIDITKNSKAKTLLIVEDEYANYELLTEYLDESKLKILYAADGLEAVNMCKENKEIDIILMDIKMPVMDGHTSANFIRKFRPDIPIIAQTAFALEVEKEKFGDVFNEYLTKPLHKQNLINTLEKFLL